MIVCSNHGAKGCWGSADLLAEVMIGEDKLDTFDGRVGRVEPGGPLLGIRPMVVR